MLNLEGFIKIRDLKQQGWSVSAIADKLQLDRKTVRKHLLDAPQDATTGPDRDGARLRGSGRASRSNCRTAIFWSRSWRVRPTSGRNETSNCVRNGRAFRTASGGSSLNSSFLPRLTGRRSANWRVCVFWSVTRTSRPTRSRQDSLGGLVGHGSHPARLQCLLR